MWADASGAKQTSKGKRLMGGILPLIAMSVQYYSIWASPLISWPVEARAAPCVWMWHVSVPLSWRGQKHGLDVDRESCIVLTSLSALGKIRLGWILAWGPPVEMFSLNWLCWIACDTAHGQKVDGCEIHLFAFWCKVRGRWILFSSELCAWKLKSVFP